MNPFGDPNNQQRIAHGQGMGSNVEPNAHCDLLVCDEAATTPLLEVTALARLKAANPQMIMVFVGDPQQTAPVEKTDHYFDPNHTYWDDGTIDAVLLANTTKNSPTEGKPVQRLCASDFKRCMRTAGPTLVAVGEHVDRVEQLQAHEFPVLVDTRRNMCFQNTTRIRVNLEKQKRLGVPTKLRCDLSYSRPKIANKYAPNSKKESKCVVTVTDECGQAHELRWRTSTNSYFQSWVLCHNNPLVAKSDIFTLHRPHLCCFRPRPSLELTY